MAILITLISLILFINPLIWRTINVVIFFGILYLLLRKPISEFFAERFKTIRASLERAAREKEEAQARMKSIDARLAQLDSETVRIKETAQQEAAAESARIKAQTEIEIEKIRETVRREIDAAKQSALIELRQFTAANAVTVAEQLIRREMTVEDDAALLQRASNELKM